VKRSILIAVDRLMPAPGGRRRRTHARFHQQGLRVPRSHRLEAGWRRAADRGGPDGGRTRRRGIDRLASAGGSRHPMPDNGGGAAKPIRRRSLWRALVRPCGRSPILLLGDDAGAIVAALKAAIRAGAAPSDLGRSLAYAAALRVARFGSANEHSDWETAHHVFTYANAVHRMLKRIETTNQDGPSRPCAASCTVRWRSTSPLS
jgi:hypothetical protein